MESTRRELGRLTAFKNPHGWAAQDCDENNHQYFRLDRNVSKQGDTPLLRLLALHTNALTVKNFLSYSLQQQSQGSDSEERFANKVKLESNHQGISPLHVILYRNSAEAADIVRQLLAVDPTMAHRHMMDTESFPLHIYTAYSLTAKSQVLEDLLVAGPSIVTQEDSDGDNPVSLLYKNVLRSRWARDWVTLNLPPDTVISDNCWMKLITPDEYCAHSLSMIEAVADPNKLSTGITWRNICAFPRCPPLLIKVLESKLPKDSLLQPDEYGQLPLHHVAKLPAISRVSIPDHVWEKSSSTLELVLNLAPQAAGVRDSSGTFPLHYALNNPTIPNCAVEALVQASPIEVLLTPDRITGLLPFQFAATRYQESNDASLESLILGILWSEPSAMRLF